MLGVRQVPSSAVRLSWRTCAKQSSVTAEDLLETLRAQSFEVSTTTEFY